MFSVYSEWIADAGSVLHMQSHALPIAVLVVFIFQKSRYCDCISVHSSSLSHWIFGSVATSAGLV